MAIEKELIDSIWQMTRLLGYTTLYAYGGKRIFSVGAPSAKLDLSDIGKLGLYLELAILTDDYAIDKGWYKDKMSR